jgi:hypothetical protein
MKASKMTLNPEANKGIAENVTVELMGVPIFCALSANIEALRLFSLFLWDIFLLYLIQVIRHHMHIS